MTPEEQARVVIDEKLEQSGWIIQDMRQLNLTASLGIAVREFPTSTGPVDYALFIEGRPVGVVEAKKSEAGENITVVEGQSARYANSTFKWVQQEYRIRFAYEATDKLVRFTDYDDIKFRSRSVFSFHRPETLKALIAAPNTVGVGTPTIDKKSVRSIRFKVPKIKEVQEEIASEIESRMSVCDSIEQTVNTALTQAEAMRQCILKEAFEGRLGAVKK